MKNWNLITQQLKILSLKKLNKLKIKLTNNKLRKDDILIYV